MLTNDDDDRPRCFWCGDTALDGHLTCGRVTCSESLARDEQRARLYDDPYDD